MTQTNAKTDIASNAADTFVISRVFNAPRELMFTLWADPEHLAKWWGPKGFTVVAGKLALKPGGTYHYCIRSPEGNDMWGKFTYREIVAPQRIVYVNSFSNEKGGLTRHPLSPTWPLELLSIITFAVQGEGTKVTVEWMPLNATEEERHTFAGGHDSMQKGWGGTMDQLQEYVKKLV